ncbi:MAG TPA: MFS transporter [Chloroflexota bacterium]|nr:MFS transporter [Chloroflexota bacterium]
MTDRSLWRNREFMLLWLAQAISQTAQNAVNYGIMVLVQTRSNSSVHMSVAVMTMILPSVIFGLVAGAYVDRRDKRWVLIGTNVLRAIATLGYVVFTEYLGLVYLTNFIFSTISQFFAPAEVAMIPAIVERRRLIQANSLFHLTFTAAQLGGLVFLGPLVVNLVGSDGLFGLVAVSLALCAALLWPLPSTRRRVQDKVEGFAALWGEVREVLSFIHADRIVSWAMVHWTLGATLAIVMAMLAPGFVVNVLGIRAENSVFVLAPAGVGMLLGTTVLSRWGQGLDRHRLTNGGLVTIGLGLSSLSFVGSLRESFHPGSPPGGIELAVVMATALVTGLAFVSVVVPAQTIIQERAPVDVRGRVFAVQLVMSNVVGVAPLLFLGELADLAGVDWTLLVLGLLVLGAGLISGVLATSARLARYQASAEPGSAA